MFLVQEPESGRFFCHFNWKPPSGTLLDHHQLQSHHLRLPIKLKFLPIFSAGPSLCHRSKKEEKRSLLPEVFPLSNFVWPSKKAMSGKSDHGGLQLHFPSYCTSSMNPASFWLKTFALVITSLPVTWLHLRTNGRSLCASETRQMGLVSSKPVFSAVALLQTTFMARPSVSRGHLGRDSSVLWVYF